MMSNIPSFPQGQAPIPANPPQVNHPGPAPPALLTIPPDWATKPVDDRITFMFQAILNQTNSINSQNANFQQQILQNSSRLNNHNQVLSVHANEINNLYSLVSQPHHKSEIVITGIPATINNPPNQIVSAIFNKIDATHLTQFIINIRPFQSKRRNQTNDAGNPLNTRADNIAYAVQLVSPDVIHLIIELKSRHKELTAAETFNNPTLLGNININELLPPHKYQLFQKVRQRKRDRNYKYAWTRRGIIYVKVDDQSAPIIIAVESDLARLP